MTKMPPVPPANRSPHETEKPSVDSAEHSVPDIEGRTRNLAEQGHQGNIKQNTTNQGYQQDR
jgi:hypothetical protein